MRERVFIPHIQIRSNGVIQYGVPDPPLSGGKFEKPTYSGTVTKGAQKRIAKAVDILIQRSPRQTVFNPITQRDTTFRLTFITLTISAAVLVPHRDAYEQGLRKFLDQMRYRGVQDYIWKAELQQRGQIHYHVTANKFVPHYEVKTVWNVLQKKAGWLDGFNEKFGHWSPNSTDIHAVRNDADIARYLGKYIAKAQANGQQIHGKVWGASRSIAGQKLFSCEMVMENADKLGKIEVEQPQTVARLEHCLIYRKATAKNVLSDEQRAQYRKWQFEVKQ
jgi:hypothetical protein